MPLRGRSVIWKAFAVAGALALVGVVVAAGVLAAGWIKEDEPAFVGTVLQPQAAPDFQLTDHRGEAVRLSDFRGKAVALTFIFTNCADVCPLTAMNMAAAYEMLPEDRRDDVVFLAVTVDPARDTPAALDAFSAQFELADNPSWFALSGDPASLAPVWQNYGIDPGGELNGDHTNHDADAGGGNGHTDAIYLIDAEGQERIFMRSTASPNDIAHNLQALQD